MGVKMFDVMPWRVVSTPRSMDVWQGRVHDGVTVRAVQLAAPFCTRRSIVGVEVVWIASGRTPSREQSNTRDFIGNGFLNRCRMPALPDTRDTGSPHPVRPKDAPAAIDRTSSRIGR